MVERFCCAKDVSVQHDPSEPAELPMPAIEWTANPQSGPAPQVTLDGVGTRPGWYSIRARIAGGPAIVQVRAKLQSGNPDLRLRLEAGAGGGYTRTIRLADGVKTVMATAEGATATGIAQIAVSPMGRLAVLRFLVAKAWRYLAARRGDFNLRLALKQLRNAIRPPANFVFRGRYAGADDADSYRRWRAIHEHPDAGAFAIAQLAAATGGRAIRIGLLAGAALDARAMARAIAKTMVGAAATIEPVSADDLAKRPDAWDFILPLDRAGRFAAGGVARLALALLADDGLAAVYADSDQLSASGERCAPRLKPHWDKAMLWCQDHIGAPLLLRWRADLLPALDGEGAAMKPAYALALALMEQRPRSALGRAHAILFHATDAATDDDADRRVLEDHLHRIAAPARIISAAGGVAHVAWATPVPPPLVSVIIPSRDHPELLMACIGSIREKTEGAQPEILVADNGSVLPETLSYLEHAAQTGIARIVPCPGPFNFSKINNQARLAARGDILVLLNDDTVVQSPGWLTELASLAMRPDIGAVGAMLLYPDGAVQHGGILLGVGGSVVEHAFRSWPGDSAGYLDLLRCRREVSAVTGACLAVSAAHYDLVGGLDEALAVTLNDVDFCLKLRARGLTNIWTPWARLEHAESKTRGLDRSCEQMARLNGELRLFAQRWRDLPPRDPLYHPGLSDLAPDYRLAV
jgi:GT2 family glycosyltransferase